jgi:acyl-CoA thioester hydrolase
MFTHTTQVRVRYGETDQMGYLYYGNYAQFYEVGRVEMMRSLDITYSDMETTHKVMMPVMSMNIQYLRPAFYDNLLTIHTSVIDFPINEMDFHVEIHNEHGKVINKAQVKLCFVDIESKKRVNIPDFLKIPLEKCFSL